MNGRDRPRRRGAPPAPTGSDRVRRGERPVPRNPRPDSLTPEFHDVDKICGLSAVAAVFRRDPGRVLRLYRRRGDGGDPGVIDRGGLARLNWLNEELDNNFSAGAFGDSPGGHLPAKDEAKGRKRLSAKRPLEPLAEQHRKASRHERVLLTLLPLSAAWQDRQFVLDVLQQTHRRTRHFPFDGMPAR